MCANNTALWAVAFYNFANRCFWYALLSCGINFLFHLAVLIFITIILLLTFLMTNMSNLHFVFRYSTLMHSIYFLLTDVTTRHHKPFHAIRTRINKFCNSFILCRPNSSTQSESSVFYCILWQLHVIFCLTSSNLCQLFWPIVSHLWCLCLIRYDIELTQ